MGVLAAVRRGRHPGRITRHLIDRYVARDTPRTEQARSLAAGLSEREREVLVMVGTGLSNAEIGAQLHMSEGTIKAYVSRILVRLGCANRVQAAILAHDAGLLPDA